MRKRIGKLLIAAASLAFSTPPGLTAQAGPRPAGTDALTPVLVELFTSEGCSSCPPADELLQQVNGKRTSSGQFIVGISEHVTYWNRLGWTDPFSSEAYTRRQNGYAERFHLDEVYTPQMVINGREQIVGGDRSQLIDAVNHKTREKPVTLKIMSVEQAKDLMTVAFNVDADRDRGPFDIFLVLTDDKDRSQVLRGENASRTLEHVAVARSFQRVATMSGSGQQTVQVTLPKALAQNPENAHHVILFAQSPDFGGVLGVTIRPW